MIQLVDVLQGWYKLPLQISFQNGTCYTVEECNRRNGINSGSCAGGYGVCCACMFAVLPTLTISIVPSINAYCNSLKWVTFDPKEIALDTGQWSQISYSWQHCLHTKDLE